MAVDKPKLEELRKPFPKEVIGKIPKGGMQLDYVGHAAVTDRLLTVDPEWSWLPLGVDEHGNPALDKEGNLWISLTVLGVTRVGVGDGRNMKERIGDALRNAAMRFGVALELWSKDELESTLETPPSKQPAKQTSAADVADMMTDNDTVVIQAEDPSGSGQTRSTRVVSLQPAQSAKIYKLGRLLGLEEDKAKWAGLQNQVAGLVTKDDGDRAIAAMEKKLKERNGG